MASKPVVRRATPVVPRSSSAPPPGAPPTRLQVVHRTGPGGSPPATPSAPLLAPAPATPPRGISIDGMVGAAAVVISTTVLILNFTLPWLARANGFGADLDRADVARVFRDDSFFGSFYLKGLVLWPLVATIAAIVLGVGLAAADFVGIARARRRAVRLVGTLGLAVSGFVLALMGVRFLGFYLVLSLSPGNSDRPLAVPYINLAAGLVLLALAAWRLHGGLVRETTTRATPAMRGTAWSLAVLAAVFLLDPLFPLGRLEITGTPTTYIGEGLLTAMGNGLLSKASDDVGLALGSLWIAFYLLLVSGMAAVAARETADRAWAMLVQLQAFAVVPLVMGLVFSLLLFTNLDRTQGAFGFGVRSRPSPNVVLPLGTLALLVLFAVYAVRVLAPFVRSVMPARPGLGGGP